MNEKELVQYYEQRGDDPSLWEEKPSKANVRRSGGVVFSLRISPDELTLLREAADRRGINVSELVRRAALRDVTAPSCDDIVKFTGDIAAEWRRPLLTAMLGLETTPPSCATPFDFGRTEGENFILIEMKGAGLVTRRSRARQTSQTDDPKHLGKYLSNHEILLGPMGWNKK